MDLGGFHIDISALLAGVFWSGLGVGYFVYGKNRQSAPALIGGFALFGISILIYGSALWMSVAGIAIMAGVYWWSRQQD